MSLLNKILTSLNQALGVQLYNLTKPDGEPQLSDSLSGLPLGTSDGSSTGELAVKVMMVGNSPGGETHVVVDEMVSGDLHTFQDAAQATGNGTPMDVGSFTSLAIQPPPAGGGRDATMFLEGTIDGTIWTIIKTFQDNGQIYPGSVFIGAGWTTANIAAFSQVRVRIASYTSGIITVTGRASYGDAVSTGVYMPVTQPGLLSFHTLTDGQSNFIHEFADASGTPGPITVAEFLFNGTTWDRARNNVEAVLLASAARSTTQTSADIINYDAVGIQVLLDMSDVSAGPDVTLSIEGKAANGVYYPLLTGAAISTVSQNVYILYPSVAAVANQAVSNALPRTFRIIVTANNANDGTYSVAYSLIK